MSAPEFDAYNHRSQFPHSYAQVANLDASNGATLAPANGTQGATLSHVVISNGDTINTRTVTLFTAFNLTEIYRVSLRASTSQVYYPGFDLLDGIFAQANSDTAGIYVTAFFNDLTR